jgi:demethylmenaquinone methyltransferase/2-methoxy-6-polyprenyl-1,4-benzoquinol methylase
MYPFNHFDFLAPIYDRYIKPADASKMRIRAKLPATGRLLDVGGGTGRASYELRKMVEGIIIADSSEGMLRRAVKKEVFSLVCSESEGLPFPDESFERVIMVDALHHVEDHRKTLSELWRVVKPGGRIVIEEPDIRTIPVMILAVVEKIALMRSHFISPVKIKDSFNSPRSVVNIDTEGTTAWVIIDKIQPSTFIS